MTQYRITMPFLTFYITHPDEATARRIADHLLQERLIACANIFPVGSAYWWDGAIQHESEWVSVVKTSIGLEEHLEAVVEAIHPYDTPCIMRVESRANAAYEKWIRDSVRQLEILKLIG